MLNFIGNSCFFEKAVIMRICFINLHFCEKKEKIPGLLSGKGFTKTMHADGTGLFPCFTVSFWKFSQQNRKATVLKLRTIAEEVVHTVPTKRSYNCRRTFNTIGSCNVKGEKFELFRGTRFCIEYHRHKNSQSIDIIASSTALGS